MRLPFDGRDDAGRPLAPGAYDVVASMTFVGDGHGLCAGDDIVHQDRSGQLATIELGI
jgi:hypothetical protein